MKSEVVEITPEMASNWLEKNKNLRKLNDARVENLTQAILRGEWELNGESIKRNGGEWIVDGQHRLEAIKRSGIPCKSVVVSGVEDVLEIDSGKTRSIVDWLRLRGETQLALLAATMRLVYRHENGVLNQCRSVVKQPTCKQLLNVLDRHPDLKVSVKKASTWSSGESTFLPKSCLAYVHYIVYKELITDSNEEHYAQEFFSKMSSGLDLKEDSPIHRFRARMIKNHNSLIGKLHQTEKLALLIKAWNLHARGESSKGLRWKPAVEEFPKLQGFSV